MAIRNLINLPGLKLTAEVNREEFVEGTAQAIGSRGYALGKLAGGKVFDDSARMVEAGDATRTQVVRVIKQGTEETGNLLSAAISEVADTSSRVAKATKTKALAAGAKQVDKHVGTHIRSVQSKGKELYATAYEAIDEYCGDQTKTPKALPPAKSESTDQPTLTSVIYDAVAATA